MVARLWSSLKNIIGGREMTDDHIQIDVFQDDHSFNFSAIGDLEQLRGYIQEAMLFLEGEFDMKLVGKRIGLYTPMDNEQVAHIYGARMRASLEMLRTSKNACECMIDKVEKRLCENHGLVGCV